MLRCRRHELGAGIEDALVDASNPSWRKYTQPIADLADTLLPGRAASQFFDAYYPVVGAIGSLLGGKSEEQRKAERAAERAKRAREEEEYVAASNKRGAAEHAAREARLEKNKPGPSTVSGDASFFYGGSLGENDRDSIDNAFLDKPPSTDELFGTEWRSISNSNPNLIPPQLAYEKLNRLFIKFQQATTWLGVDLLQYEDLARWRAALEEYDEFLQNYMEYGNKAGRPAYNIIKRWERMLSVTLNNPNHGDDH